MGKAFLIPTLRPHWISTQMFLGVNPKGPPSAAMTALFTTDYSCALISSLATLYHDMVTT